MMMVCEKYFRNGGEIDYTAHYRDMQHGIIREARMSLRKSAGAYELYLFWFDTKEEEILKRSESLKDVVEFANEIMRSLGYKNWRDYVGEC